MNLKDLQEKIEAAWENRRLLSDEATMKAIDTIVDLLDRGELRVATPSDKGWIVHEWVKKAVILYFPFRKMETKEGKALVGEILNDFDSLIDKVADKSVENRGVHLKQVRREFEEKAAILIGKLNALA